MTYRRLVVVGVGEGYEHQIPWVHKALTCVGLPLDLPTEHFDMSTWPEKGDVLDNMKEGDIVVAAHIAFFCRDLHGYFYNRNNADIVVVAHKLNIPVILLGEQPTGDNQPYGILYVRGSAPRKLPSALGKGPRPIYGEQLTKP